MTQKHSYIPRGVCARQIDFELSDDGKTIENVSFVGGCDGNLKAIGKLLNGADVDETISLLLGNDCRGRGTSCADQLALALQKKVHLGDS